VVRIDAKIPIARDSRPPQAGALQLDLQWRDVLTSSPSAVAMPNPDQPVPPGRWWGVDEHRFRYIIPLLCYPRIFRARSGGAAGGALLNNLQPIGVGAGGTGALWGITAR